MVTRTILELVCILSRSIGIPTLLVKLSNFALNINFLLMFKLIHEVSNIVQYSSSTIRLELLHTNITTTTKIVTNYTSKKMILTLYDQRHL